MTVSLAHRFTGTDPHLNLAREELWLDRLPPGASALLLYVNRPSVVIGKNQNPIREVRLDRAADRGVPLLRRASGGGTVWHDEGNLNWSLILPKADYDREAVSAAVARALSPLGRTVTVGDKGDLLFGGRKVSGAAYLHRRDRVLHHGTLLCRARLDDLRGLLGETGTVLESVGVASRPSPVTNLDLDVDAAAGALVDAFGGAALGTGLGDRDFEAAVGDRARDRRSPDWLWDQTPRFTWEGPTRLGWLRLRVEAGRVTEVLSPDDRSLNMSNIVGKSFFDPELFEYIPIREAL